MDYAEEMSDGGPAEVGEWDTEDESGAWGIAIGMAQELIRKQGVSLGHGITRSVNQVEVETLVDGCIRPGLHDPVDKDSNANHEKHWAYDCGVALSSREEASTFLVAHASTGYIPDSCEPRSSAPGGPPIPRQGRGVATRQPEVKIRLVTSLSRWRVNGVPRTFGDTH